MGPRKMGIILIFVCPLSTILFGSVTGVLAFSNSTAVLCSHRASYRNRTCSMKALPTKIKQPFHKLRLGILLPQLSYYLPFLFYYFYLLKPKAKSI